MKREGSLQIFNARPTACAQPAKGFTLVELLVVLAVLAILVATLISAQAGGNNKGGWAQCAANLRQLWTATMLYANDFSTKLPTSQHGSSPVNVINGTFYTRYVWEGNPGQLPQAYNTGISGAWQNAGFLYAGGYLTNAALLYCPAQGSSFFFGATAYSPPLTTDSMGVVRSSYNYNPRVAKPTGSSVADMQRRYQRTTQMEPKAFFASDLLEVGVVPDSFAHFRERGWNVLLTDGSVHFSQNDRVYDLVKQMPATSGINNALAEQAFILMENE